MPLKLFLLLLLLSQSLAAKKKTTSSSADKKPKSVDQEIYCGACQAIVRETVKRLHHKSSESEVIAAMDDLCDMWKYKTYDFPPPQIAKGCDAIQSYYEEDLEWALVHRNELQEGVETYFCYTKTGACKDVDMADAKRSDDFVTLDGEKVPLKDGKINL